MSFPILFGKASNGKVKVWQIGVEQRPECSIVVIKYNYEGGKVVEAKQEISNGKNIGKTNQTTHYEQAVSQARAKWNQKKDSGYTESVEKLSKNVLPMLALDYFKRGKDIIFPCFVQPKLDGIRSLWYDNKMHSRKNKEFYLKSIEEELSGTSIILDGELYSDKISFQELVGLVKRKDADTDLVNFVVYDLVSPDDYEKRLNTLKKIKRSKHIKLIQTEICNDSSELIKFHEKYVALGYEGLMIRNFKGPYQENARSKNLQKYKLFQEEEFQIVGFTQGVGIEKGLVIWKCSTKEGKEFSVRPEGDHALRAEQYNNGQKYIGMLLTVKFFEYTNDKVPRFPTGKGIRNYE